MSSRVSARWARNFWLKSPITLFLARYLHRDEKILSAMPCVPGGMKDMGGGTSGSLQPLTVVEEQFSHTD